MEQQLINSLMKLLAKAGGGSLIKDLIQQVDMNGNPKVWTPEETEKAVQYVNWQIENFGTAEAAAILESLVRKYHLNTENFTAPADQDLSEAPGVQGLQ